MPVKQEALLLAVLVPRSLGQGWVPLCCSQGMQSHYIPTLRVCKLCSCVQYPLSYQVKAVWWKLSPFNVSCQRECMWSTGEAEAKFPRRRNLHSASQISISCKYFWLHLFFSTRWPLKSISASFVLHSWTHYTDLTATKHLNSLWVPSTKNSHLFRYTLLHNKCYSVIT